MTQNQTVVFYHKLCPDGFCGAAIAYSVFGDTADYLPCAYGDKPSVDVYNKDVYIIDFSFPLEVLDSIGKQARKLVVLDHHETAKNALQAFKPVCCGKVHFDLAKCGAALAWEHFYPNKPMPYLVEAVQSRDLWHWNVPDDKAFLAYLDSLPFDLSLWAALLQQEPEQLSAQVLKGAAMNLKFDSLCEDIGKEYMPVVIDGISGLMCNAPACVVSNIGEALAKKSGTFGLLWRLLPNGQIKCSMRAVKPFEVRTIAEKFGGGGHPQAASFVLPGERIIDIVRGNISL